MRRMNTNPKIGKEVQLDNVTFGKFVQIAEYSYLSNTKIGDYSYCNGFNQIMNANIGKFVSIASGVKINAINHPYEWVSQHNFLYLSEQYDFGENDEEFLLKRMKNIVNIGNDVWIGYNAIIMPGINIGDGAVIGSGAIVTKDVEPYSIVAGVPAMFLKKRFSDDVINELKKIKWWDWSREDLRKRKEDFKNIEQFIKLYKVDDI